jgi:hypothetical protein
MISWVASAIFVHRVPHATKFGIFGSLGLVVAQIDYFGGS